MNSLVCVAYVPDTETKIKIGADGKSIDEADVKWIVSPYDEYGLEEALRIKEKKGAGTVTVVAVGPERVKTGLAGVPGARRGRGDLGGRHGRSVSRRARDREGPRRGREGGRLRPLLVRTEGRGLRRVPRRADVRGARGRAPRRQRREAGDGRRQAHGATGKSKARTRSSSARIPAVLTAQKGLNEPRYASLKGIMAREEEADRRKEARRARRSGGRSRAGEDALAQARAAARATGREARVRGRSRRGREGAGEAPS